MSKSNTNSTQSEITKKIRALQLEELQKLKILSLSIAIVALFLISYFLKAVADPLTLKIWITVFFSVILIQLLAAAYYQKNKTINLNTEFWLKSEIAHSIAQSTGWGAIVLFFYNAEPIEHGLIVLVVVAGINTSVVSFLAAHMPSIYAFFGIQLLLINGRLLSEGDSYHILFAILLSGLLVGMVFFAHRINRSIIQTYQLRFENLDLVQDLKKQRKEAEEANLAKTRFLAAASHDLRQPLQAMALFVEELDLQSKEGKVPTNNLVNNLQESINNLKVQFNALLDLSRLDSGNIKPSIQDFNLEILLHNISREFGPTARAKGLQWTIESKNTNVTSDPALLEAVLRNLVSNAIRYTDSGRVSLVCTEEERRVRISVIDTGKGIDQAEQKTIFQEYYQLGNPERDRRKGLGLGLAIVDRLNQLLDLSLNVDSKLGAGSTFTITLTKSTQNPVHEIPSVSINQVSPDLMNKTIVVIDDDKEIRESFEVLLSRWGATIVSFMDFESAMKNLAIYQSVDLIIADYRLPNNKNGVDGLNKLHSALGKSISSFLITGDTDPEHLTNATKSQYPLLYKPVSAQELAYSIAQAFESDN